ncbi:hypothetical protein EK21DRAFT_114272 [Setomelanomma holmii]|uniref:Uncharacterized protein n=1 Tax=Setomelanomma holmii TaxID=210430 RepID=A0A9P4H6M6_9PLEO|nr:hypothetical protein EK21DRAFT_114272 [Setomelanomma holmii]
MPSQVGITQMDMDSDREASIKSDSSHVSYTDEYETLPATGPTNHAHIIDLGEYAQRAKEDGNLKLQDAVATTLYSVSPDMLKSFLSPTIHTAKIVFGKKDVQLVIWRKGLEVFVGTFESHTSMKTFRFEHVAGFLIGYDGSWHLKVTASNAYSSPKWPDVWAGKFEDRGGVTKMSVECDEEGMGKQASSLAESMLAMRYWQAKVDIKTA